MSLAAVRRAVWDGSIPCRIDLDPSECRSLEGIDPYFITIPRISYLPIIIPKVYRFFEPHLKDTARAQQNSAWFEFENVPLKWHWPVGVLFDQTTGRDPSHLRHSRIADEDDDVKLPWSLSLRFQNFPTKHLMRLDLPNACHDAWKNTVKEADHVRNGNPNTFMSLSRGDSASLWEAICTHDFEIFWGINEKLLNPPSGPIKFIPCRIYIPSSTRVIQAPCPPYITSSDRDPQTLGLFLHNQLPQLFPSRRSPMIARPVVHGAIVPWTAPVLELAQAAVHADGFLHITIAMVQ
ncbi:APG5-domain-containing protein [Ascodesmis nigricans]|uniref:Autophagy protein 5 n=1 Tax=Ascodesmis nigricans TaxID=341454 RepID=A0A4S2N769_9PEZI|nr:APG5-domain-containing protein [Ascodesmis nigricans]